MYKVGAVMAIVASLETLLCVEATDKLDPFKRVTPTNRELKAQGLGNLISGLIGGLPVTQVVVRSSANISFGAKTKLSAIMHGFFLLISVVTISSLLNMIPLARPYLGDEEWQAAHRAARKFASTRSTPE